MSLAGCALTSRMQETSTHQQCKETLLSHSLQARFWHAGCLACEDATNKYYEKSSFESVSAMQLNSVASRLLEAMSAAASDESDL